MPGASRQRNQRAEAAAIDDRVPAAEPLARTIATLDAALRVWELKQSERLPSASRRSALK